jgi:hypothetical protein
MPSSGAPIPPATDRSVLRHQGIDLLPQPGMVLLHGPRDDGEMETVVLRRHQPCVGRGSERDGPAVAAAEDTGWSTTTRPDRPVPS